MSLDTDTALTPAGDGAWAGEIAAGWQTPRGPLGGYVMAIVLRAMSEAVADPERRPRSATMHFLRVPELGPVTVRARVERAGRSLSSTSARLEQDGRLLGLALASHSLAWAGPRFEQESAPDVGPPDGREPIEGPDAGRPVPTFAGRLTMQRRYGPAPFSGAEHAEAGGWLGLIEEREIDALTIAVLADAWFPTPWARLTEFAPAPTIDLTIHFRAPLPVPDSLLMGRFRNQVVRDGFFDEDGELWTPDGVLVAQSRQLGLLIGA